MMGFEASLLSDQPPLSKHICVGPLSVCLEQAKSRVGRLEAIYAHIDLPCLQYNPCLTYVHGFVRHDEKCPLLKLFYQVNVNIDIHILSELLSH